VFTLRLLIPTSRIMALFCAVSAAYAADPRFNVCMGNGGGPSCAAGSALTLTCDEYKKIGGGGPQTPPALGARLCNYYKDGKQEQLPFSVAHIYSRGGGECGSTLFTVTCFAPKSQ
jgi:hypothetical protein